MKVVFYNPFVFWHLYYYQTLELAMEHMGAGDDVKFIQCQAELATCETNRGHNLSVCATCILQRDTLYEKAGIKPNQIHNLRLPKVSDINFPEFKSVKDLKEYQMLGIPLGMFAASSLITLTTDVSPNVHAYKRYVDLLLTEALKIYKAVRSFLEVEQPNRLYLYNGRLASVRPAFQAAKDLGIPAFLHEDFSKKDRRFFCIEFGDVFSLDDFKKSIKDHWDANLDKNKKTDIAKIWFFEKRYGSLNKGVKHVIPLDLDIKKRNKVVFLSSEDEGSTINQKNFKPCIDKVIKIARSEPDVIFWLRMHPWTGPTFPSQLTNILSIREPNTRIVMPKMQVDSYALMEVCEETIVFGSTIGVEAMFWGKNVRLIGDATYADCDPLEYGYYAATFGREYKHSDPETDCFMDYDPRGFRDPKKIKKIVDKIS